jgi:hypothetical protein
MDTQFCGRIAEPDETPAPEWHVFVRPYGKGH